MANQNPDINIKPKDPILDFMTDVRVNPKEEFIGGIGDSIKFNRDVEIARKILEKPDYQGLPPADTQKLLRTTMSLTDAWKKELPSLEYQARVMNQVIPVSPGIDLPGPTPGQVFRKTVIPTLSELENAAYPVLTGFAKPAFVGMKVVGQIMQAEKPTIQKPEITTPEQWKEMQIQTNVPYGPSPQRPIVGMLKTSKPPKTTDMPSGVSITKETSIYLSPEVYKKVEANAKQYKITNETSYSILTSLGELNKPGLIVKDLDTKFISYLEKKYYEILKDAENNKPSTLKTGEWIENVANFGLYAGRETTEQKLGAQAGEMVFALGFAYPWLAQKISILNAPLLQKLIPLLKESPTTTKYLPAMFSMAQIGGTLRLSNELMNQLASEETDFKKLATSYTRGAGEWSIFGAIGVTDIGGNLASLFQGIAYPAAAAYSDACESYAKDGKIEWKDMLLGTAMVAFFFSRHSGQNIKRLRRATELNSARFIEERVEEYYFLRAIVEGKLPAVLGDAKSMAQAKLVWKAGINLKPEYTSDGTVKEPLSLVGIDLRESQRGAKQIAIQAWKPSNTHSVPTTKDYENALIRFKNEWNNYFKGKGVDITVPEDISYRDFARKTATLFGAAKEKVSKKIYEFSKETVASVNRATAGQIGLTTEIIPDAKYQSFIKQVTGETKTVDDAGKKLVDSLVQEWGKAVYPDNIDTFNATAIAFWNHFGTGEIEFRGEYKTPYANGKPILVNELLKGAGKIFEPPVEKKVEEIKTPVVSEPIPEKVVKEVVAEEPTTPTEITAQPEVILKPIKEARLENPIGIKGGKQPIHNLTPMVGTETDPAIGQLAWDIKAPSLAPSDAIGTITGIYEAEIGETVARHRPDIGNIGIAKTLRRRESDNVKQINLFLDVVGKDFIEPVKEIITSHSADEFNGNVDTLKTNLATVGTSLTKEIEETLLKLFAQNSQVNKLGKPIYAIQKPNGDIVYYETEDIWNSTPDNWLQNKWNVIVAKEFQAPITTTEIKDSSLALEFCSVIQRILHEDPNASQQQVLADPIFDHTEDNLSSSFDYWTENELTLLFDYAKNNPQITDADIEKAHALPRFELETSDYARTLVRVLKSKEKEEIEQGLAIIRYRLQHNHTTDELVEMVGKENKSKSESIKEALGLSSLRLVEAVEKDLDLEAPSVTLKPDPAFDVLVDNLKQHKQNLETKGIAASRLRAGDAKKVPEVTEHVELDKKERRETLEKLHASYKQAAIEARKESEAESKNIEPIFRDKIEAINKELIFKEGPSGLELRDARLLGPLRHVYQNLHKYLNEKAPPTIKPDTTTKERKQDEEAGLTGFFRNVPEVLRQSNLKIWKPDFDPTFKGNDIGLAQKMFDDWILSIGEDTPGEFELSTKNINFGLDQLSTSLNLNFHTNLAYGRYEEKNYKRTPIKDYLKGYIFNTKMLGGTEAEAMQRLSQALKDIQPLFENNITITERINFLNKVLADQNLEMVESKPQYYIVQPIGSNEDSPWPASTGRIDGIKGKEGLLSAVSKLGERTGKAKTDEDIFDSLASVYKWIKLGRSVEDLYHKSIHEVNRINYYGEAALYLMLSDINPLFSPNSPSGDIYTRMQMLLSKPERRNIGDPAPQRETLQKEINDLHLKWQEKFKDEKGVLRTLPFSEWSYAGPKLLQNTSTSGTPITSDTIIEAVLNPNGTYSFYISVEKTEHILIDARELQEGINTAIHRGIAAQDIELFTFKPSDTTEESGVFGMANGKLVFRTYAYSDATVEELPLLEHKDRSLTKGYTLVEGREKALLYDAAPPKNIAYAEPDDETGNLCITLNIPTYRLEDEHERITWLKKVFTKEQLTTLNKLNLTAIQDPKDYSKWTIVSRETDPAIRQNIPIVTKRFEVPQTHNVLGALQDIQAILLGKLLNFPEEKFLGKFLLGKTISIPQSSAEDLAHAVDARLAELKEKLYPKTPQELNPTYWEKEKELEHLDIPGITTGVTIRSLTPEFKEKKTKDRITYDVSDLYNKIASLTKPGEPDLSTTYFIIPLGIDINILKTRVTEIFNSGEASLGIRNIFEDEDPEEATKIQKLEQLNQLLDTYKKRFDAGLILITDDLNFAIQVNKIKTAQDIEFIRMPEGLTPAAFPIIATKALWGLEANVYTTTLTPGLGISLKPETAKIKPVKVPYIESKDLVGTYVTSDGKNFQIENHYTITQEDWNNNTRSIGNSTFLEGLRQYIYKLFGDIYKPEYDPQEYTNFLRQLKVNGVAEITIFKEIKTFPEWDVKKKVEITNENFLRHNKTKGDQLYDNIIDSIILSDQLKLSGDIGKAETYKEIKAKMSGVWNPPGNKETYAAIIKIDGYEFRQAVMRKFQDNPEAGDAFLRRFESLEESHMVVPIKISFKTGNVVFVEESRNKKNIPSLPNIVFTQEQYNNGLLNFPTPEDYEFFIQGTKDGRTGIKVTNKAGETIQRISGGRELLEVIAGHAVNSIIEEQGPDGSESLERIYGKGNQSQINRSLGTTGFAELIVKHLFDKYPDASFNIKLGHLETLLDPSKKFSVKLSKILNWVPNVIEDNKLIPAHYEARGEHYLSEDGIAVATAWKNWNADNAGSKIGLKHLMYVPMGRYYIGFGKGLTRGEAIHGDISEAGTESTEIKVIEGAQTSGINDAKIKVVIHITTNVTKANLNERWKETREVYDRLRDIAFQEDQGTREQAWIDFQSDKHSSFIEGIMQSAMRESDLDKWIGGTIKERDTILNKLESAIFRDMNPRDVSILNTQRYEESLLNAGFKNAEGGYRKITNELAGLGNYHGPYSSNSTFYGPDEEVLHINIPLRRGATYDDLIEALNESRMNIGNINYALYEKRKTSFDGLEESPIQQLLAPVKYDKEGRPINRPFVVDIDMAELTYDPKLRGMVIKSFDDFMSQAATITRSPETNITPIEEPVWKTVTVNGKKKEEYGTKTVGQKITIYNEWFNLDQDKNYQALYKSIEASVAEQFGSVVGKNGVVLISKRGKLTGEPPRIEITVNSTDFEKAKEILTFLQNKNLVKPTISKTQNGWLLPQYVHDVPTEKNIKNWIEQEHAEFISRADITISGLDAKTPKEFWNIIEESGFKPGNLIPLLSTLRNDTTELTDIGRRNAQWLINVCIKNKLTDVGSLAATDPNMITFIYNINPTLYEEWIGAVYENFSNFKGERNAKLINSLWSFVNQNMVIEGEWKPEYDKMFDVSFQNLNTEALKVLTGLKSKDEPKKALLVYLIENQDKLTSSIWKRVRVGATEEIFVRTEVTDEDVIGVGKEPFKKVIKPLAKEISEADKDLIKNLEALNQLFNELPEKWKKQTPPSTRRRQAGLPFEEGGPVSSVIARDIKTLTNLLNAPKKQYVFEICRTGMFENLRSFFREVGFDDSKIDGFLGTHGDPQPFLPADMELMEKKGVRLSTIKLNDLISNLIVREVNKLFPSGYSLKGSIKEEDPRRVLTNDAITLLENSRERIIHNLQVIASNPAYNGKLMVDLYTLIQKYPAVLEAYGIQPLTSDILRESRIDKEATGTIPLEAKEQEITEPFKAEPQKKLKPVVPLTPEEKLKETEPYKDHPLPEDMPTLKFKNGKWTTIDKKLASLILVMIAGIWKAIDILKKQDEQT